MANLTPTIIRLPEEDLAKYKTLAAMENLSFSALVREALQTLFPTVSKKGSKKFNFWDIGRLAVNSKIKDASLKHDYYLNRLHKEKK